MKTTLHFYLLKLKISEFHNWFLEHNKVGIKQHKEDFIVK